MKMYIMAGMQGTFPQFQTMLLQQYGYTMTTEFDLEQFAFDNDLEIQVEWIH